jgi:hypothetical protein
MAERITWKIVAGVEKRFTFERSGQIAVPAYDLVRVSIAAQAAAAKVDVQPSGSVSVLYIEASRYGTELSYTVKGGGAENIQLDSPQLFLGQGMIGLLKKAPKTLVFKNAFAEEVVVTILVGREA